jgi:N-acetylglucosaminyldiphosphoundecaprenol N-acetyl-beta-D-mannosaminyltransferase
MKEIEIFTIKVHPLRRSEFLSMIRSNLKNGIQTAQFGVNSATVNEIVRNQEYRRAICNADLVNIDGMSVVWALRFLGFKVPERIATPDLADEVIEMAEKEQFSVFLFGAKETILTSCLKRLQDTYPGLKIAGSQNGYYKKESEHLIVDMINDAKPDILLIGVSSPNKELFCEKYRHELNAKYILGVGGYFDILSGHTRRAPKWMQNAGLEWFFRLIQEPRRMWKRYLIGINKFLWLVIKEKIKKNRTRT